MSDEDPPPPPEPEPDEAELMRLAEEIMARRRRVLAVLAQ